MLEISALVINFFKTCEQILELKFIFFLLPDKTHFLKLFLLTILLCFFILSWNQFLFWYNQNLFNLNIFLSFFSFKRYLCLLIDKFINYIRIGNKYNLFICLLNSSFLILFNLVLILILQGCPRLNNLYFNNCLFVEL